MYYAKRANYKLATWSMIFFLAACSTTEKSPTTHPTTIRPTTHPTTVHPTSILPTITALPLKPTMITTAEPATMPTAIDISGLAHPTLPNLPPQTPYGIELLSGYKIMHILRPTLLMPTDIKISPDGRIFFFEMEGRQILELAYDGTISTFSELDKPCNGMLINSSSELFVLQGDELIKISPLGEKTFVDRIINVRGWAFDSQDNLFMIMEGELIRYSQNGEKTVLVTGLEGGNMVISPSGDFYIASGSTGEIIKVTQNGTISTLVSGFPLDAFNIAFDPQGNLYQNANYFTQVSLEDGNFSSPILRDYNILLVSRPFAFTPTGDVIFIGPTSNNVFKASIQDNTVSVLVSGIGNSEALAFSPSGDLFMGASNEFPLAPGRIIKILPNGQVSDYATGFFTVRDLIFDNDGNMFVSDIDTAGQGGGRLIKITPEGKGSIILTAHYDLSSMVFNPAAGDILAFNEHKGELLKITQAGNVETIPIDFGGQARSIDLALDNKGNYIALVVFDENYNIGPVHRGLFRITSENQATLITNIDTPMATSQDDVFVSPSGEIFVIGPEEHPNFRLLKISTQGEVTVVARKLPYDTLSLVVSNIGDIYFTCSAGLFRISQIE